MKGKFMRLLSKYESYEPKLVELKNEYPFSGLVLGILENESIATIHREFGGTVNDTPFDMWSKVFEAAKFHTENCVNRIIN